MFAATVNCDSLAPCGKRLATVVATYPRFIHAEVLTHRDRERNSASSRAIPWLTMQEQIESNPVIPIRWGSEQKGMQTGGEIEQTEWATMEWLEARDDAVRHAKNLAGLGVHKSLVNRLTEPFMWITVVMSATEWKNFFRLRCHEHAEIHFQKIAGMIRDALEASTPRPLKAGGLHLPFWDIADVQRLGAMRFDDMRALIPDFERDDNASVMREISRRVSTARIARVSYLTHGSTERSFEKDLNLFTTLVNGSGFGHWSPHGHVAEAAATKIRSGPFVGFNQYRKSFANECADVELPNWLIGRTVKPKLISHHLYRVTDHPVACVVDTLPDGTYGIRSGEHVPESGRLLLVLNSLDMQSGAIIEPADEWVTA